jgi:pimeloyl-ACP methyl ester carboxylesterase
MHNGGADQMVWLRQLEFFHKNFQVIAFDFLGYGKSDKHTGPYTLESQLLQLEKVVEHFELIEFFVVGNCVGASTAIEYALRNSGRIKKMALANVCGGPSFFWTLRTFGRIRPLLRAVMWVFNRFLYSPERLFGDKPTPADPLLEYYKQALKRDNDFTNTRYKMTVGSFTFSKFGTKLELPVDFPPNILFWGTKNKVMPFKYAELCRSYLKSKKHFYLEGAGHFCLHEKADFVNLEINEFFCANQ